MALGDARRALAEGDPATSLSKIDEYSQSFAQPALLPEATVLRIEAFVALGRIEEARQVAGRMLSDQPDSPYARRIRSLVGAQAPTVPVIRIGGSGH